MPSKKRAHGQHTSFQDKFEEKFFTETFDRKAALFLQAQDDQFFGHDGDSDHDALMVNEEDSIFERVSEQEYCRSFLVKSKNSDKIRVTYDKAFKDVAEDQRWFAKGHSMQSCKSKLRATLCKDIYIDLDIENCGPTILEQLCKKHDIECSLLSDYVENREDKLSEFKPFLDRGQAKEFMVRILNGGSIQEHERDELKSVDWLPKFIEQLYKIRHRIAQEYSCTAKRYPADTPNRDAKVTSAVLLAEENKAIEHYYTFFKIKGIIKNGECVLIFDGVMVRDTKSNREHLTTDFLLEASKYVKTHTGLLLKIRIKEFTEGYVLPADYKTVPDNFFVIEAGHDQAAADILVKAAGDRLVKCGDRYLYCHKDVNFSEGENEAKDGIMNLTRYVSIVYDNGSGRTAHYSNDTARMKCAIPRVLCDPSIKDDRFVEKLWDSNRGFLAYTNGVYSFKDRRLLTFEEAREKGIRFTLNTKRAYTAEVADKFMEDLVTRVFEGFLPDVDQRKSLLNHLSRALAGHIEDKRWFVCMGMRNCGKGILCKLLMYAFGDFVQGTNAENLLVKDGHAQDAAKALSWMKDLEFKRITFTNEMPVGKKTMDGDMIKKICSNGDWIEMRQNFKNESRIRSQSTLVVMVNDIPNVSPADAYQTMTAYKFDNEYHDISEFKELKERGVETPSNWLEMNHTTDEFIRQEGVIDAFTAFIFEAYTPERQVPPQRVKDDTNSIKGEASMSVQERFAEIIVEGEKTDVLFIKEIKVILEECGVGTFSSGKIDTLVKLEYNIDRAKRSRKDEHGKSVSDWGCKGLRINGQHYNDREQKLKRTEHLKQSARMGFTNQNASPASESGRDEVHQQVPLQAPREVYKDMGIACIPLPRKRTDEEERVHRQSNAA
jgi:Mg2+ and Co2+ transporter CorA